MYVGPKWAACIVYNNILFSFNIESDIPQNVYK